MPTPEEQAKLAKMLAEHKSPPTRRSPQRGLIPLTHSPQLAAFIGMEVTEEIVDRWLVATAEKFSPGLIADLETLRKEGFPELHARAFQDTADRTNCVIACRVPGADKTTVIEAGYDLKSFLIKPKSCDWGPMAGFLCQLTCFNKKGSKKIDYNDENFVKYFNYIRDKCDPKSPLKPNAVKFDSELAKAVEAGQTPFIPLKITNTRKDEQLKLIPNQWRSLPDESNPTQIVGYALDTDKTVLMEFLLNKEQGTGAEPIWGVYHGRVFFRTVADSGEGGAVTYGEWTDFANEQLSYLDRNAEGKLEVRDKTKDQGRTVAELLETPPASLVAPTVPATISPPVGGDDYLNEALSKAPYNRPSVANRTFYPVNVAQNPFPPYFVRDQAKNESDDAYKANKERDEKELELYKNAVTGDYDLFAIWPVQPVVSWRDLVRLNDMRATPAPATSIFLPVGAKPFALEIRATPDVYIEVIPGFTEIDPYENQEIGNITNGTITVAQYLNDRVTIQSKRGFRSANASFHSDEGGRPGIDEIDYDFAVFLPSDLAESLLPKQATGGPISALLITNHIQFVELIGLLADHCFVMLNHVWLTHLFTMLHPTLATLGDTVTTKKEADKPDKAAKIVKKRKDFLKDRVREKNKLGQSEIDAINKGLASLFLGKTRAQKMLDNAPGSLPWKNVWNTLVDAFVSLAIRDFENATAQVAALMLMQVVLPTPPASPPPAGGTNSPRTKPASG
ncbi:MAG: hypothetical protein IPM84_04100 [Anaerolineae bacterium]|nr:hypothetical protein [Anaerolineae bacterium]